MNLYPRGGLGGLGSTTLAPIDLGSFFNGGTVAGDNPPLITPTQTPLNTPINTSSLAPTSGQVINSPVFVGGSNVSARQVTQASLLGITQGGFASPSSLVNTSSISSGLPLATGGTSGQSGSLGTLLNSLLGTSSAVASGAGTASGGSGSIIFPVIIIGAVALLILGGTKR